jgi:hypothetical protein
MSETCANNERKAEEEVAKIDDSFRFTTCKEDAARSPSICNMAWAVAKACSRACQICKDDKGAVALCEGKFLVNISNPKI